MNFKGGGKLKSFLSVTVPVNTQSLFRFSDTGTEPPESCIFSQLLNIIALLGEVHLCVWTWAQNAV